MPNLDRMKAAAAALLWIGAYLALACAPLVLLLVGDVPPGGGLWWDFAMALGFAGMAIMGLQFVLTARFRRAAAGVCRTAGRSGSARLRRVILGRRRRSATRMPNYPCRARSDIQSSRE